MWPQARGIASGLLYLHGKGIVHGDVKSVRGTDLILSQSHLPINLQSNILISISGEPLICDFGLSDMLKTVASLVLSFSNEGSARGTVRWMAPELLHSEDDIDEEDEDEENADAGEKPTTPAKPKDLEKGDVWAFGMVMLVRAFSNI